MAKLYYLRHNRYGLTTNGTDEYYAYNTKAARDKACEDWRRNEKISRGEMLKGTKAPRVTLPIENEKGDLICYQIVGAY